MSRSALMESSLLGLEPSRRGKVRDIYQIQSGLIMVTTDRISAFDWVLPNGIPDKGRVLTKLSEFWFGRFDGDHHLLTTNLDEMGLPKAPGHDQLEGRTMMTIATQVYPVECVVRGYLVGSGWKEYRRDGTVCGLRLPPGLREAEQLPTPIFTPATKAETGHDINISFEQMIEIVGPEVATSLRDESIDLYIRGAEYALQRGIIIADTKFEWGCVCSSGPILIDEVLTPDSSRFWPADQYKPGSTPPSFDKQFVRDYLETTGWDKNSPPPPLPDDVVAKTREKYIQAYELLTEQPFAWK